MYAAAATGYAHTASADGAGASAAAVEEEEPPVIMPVQSFESHDAFRHYFFRNLSVFCLNAGATRV
jgi:hypothetical protein